MHLGLRQVRALSRRAALVLLVATAGCDFVIDDDEQADRLARAQDTGQGADPDGDGDGHDAVAQGGDDCDDTDDAVHPGADELCNEVDDDCDEDIDEEAVDANQYMPDDDGDGWGRPDQKVVQCEPPENHILWADVQPDCDDGDEEVNPGADEICDEKDNDCDEDVDEDLTGSWYEDVDGDGYGDPDSLAEGCPPEGTWIEVADDCDDDDGGVNPEAEEICGDEIDQDCSDVADACPVLELDDADLEGPGEAAGDRYGFALSAFDGRVLVGGPGASDDAGGAWLHLEPESSQLTATMADLQVSGDAAGTEAGRAVALTDDLLAAGALSLAVGAPGYGGQGAVALFTAVPGDTRALEDADAFVLASTDSGTLGAVLAAGGDLSGDGVPDLLVGDPAYGADTVGAAWILTGPVSGLVEIDSYDRLTGAETAGNAGRGLAVVGDVNGDGDADIGVGAPQVGDFNGQAFLALGPIGGNLDLVDADAIISTPDAYSMLGHPIAGGDVDGDGTSDLLVGAIGLDRSSYETGKVGLTFVFTGLDLDLPGGVDAATATIEQEEDYDSTDPQDEGLGLDTADVDGDGLEDVLLGYPHRSQDSFGMGTVYLVHGGMAGTVPLSLAQARFVANGPEDLAGRSVVLEDLDGDGLADPVVGAPGPATATGRAFAFFAGSW